MTIVAAVVGAIMMTGLVWFMYGDGTAPIDRTLADRRGAKLHAKNEAAFGPLACVRFETPSMPPAC